MTYVLSTLSPREDGYELENIPFYVKGVAAGDIVNAEEASDGGLEFVRVVRRGGHSCYRLWLRQRSESEPQSTIDELKRLGVRIEADVKYLLAVDVPPEVSLGNVENFLFQGEDSGRWGLQEGYRAGD